MENEKKKLLSIKDRITNVLVKKKVLAEKDMEKALETQKEKGGKLSDILVAMGLISRNELVSALSEELGIPPIDLSRYKVSEDTIKLVPKKIAKNYKIMPVSKMGNVLTVAIADPLDVFTTDDIASITGCKISVLISSEKDINEAFIQYYEGGAHEAIEKIIDDMVPQTAGAGGTIEMVDDGDMKFMSSGELMQLGQEAPVVKITNMLLAEGIKMRASDILIEPLEHSLRVRYRIDGILQEGQRPPKRIHPALISRLKVMSDLNIAERRLPQDGRFKIKIYNRQVDFRISVIPSNTGEKIALRVLDKSQAMLDLERLGFEKEPLEAIRKAAMRPHGMILSCGPTGCGKTTTLYSVLKFVDAPEKNIVTVEDPVEYQLDGINQVTVRPAIDLTFASTLRSFLRQDPDIIMVGEIRDFETVDIAIKAALTGHLVLSTVHTTTASSSIIRLVNMGVEPFLITSSVVLVVAQRLVRKICSDCKESYELDSVIAKKLQIKTDDHTVHRGKGCPSCQKTGYKGRVGICEALPLTPEIRKLVLEKADEAAIREVGRKQGMRTLRENGIRKILAGVTTVEEILRVTVGDQDVPLGK